MVIYFGVGYLQIISSSFVNIYVSLIFEDILVILPDFNLYSVPFHYFFSQLFMSKFLFFLVWLAVGAF